jgi:hypothetical protein
MAKGFCLMVPFGRKLNVSGASETVFSTQQGGTMTDEIYSRGH